MNHRVNSLGSCAFCLGLILLAGCFPEESLNWSADGSVGVLMTGSKLHIVDGNTGALSPNVVDDASPWPDISADGRRIVYSQQVKHTTLAEGLKALPANQAAMLAKDAKSLREKLLSGSLSNVSFIDFNAVSDEQLGFEKPYRQWVMRSLCENADEQLAKRLGDQALQQGRTAELASSRLTVAVLPDIEHGKIITTSVLGILRPRFSPDGRYVAYLTLGPSKEIEAHLFVAPLQQGASTMYIASNVSLGFAWRQDSRALAYLQIEKEEMMLGSLREQNVCDPNGRLLEKTPDDPEASWAARDCASESKQLVGTFVDPLMAVEYGIGGRLFFSSASAKIPSSDLDEPSYSLFCYDPVTGAVADVLPSKARNEQPLGEMVNFFSLSPDGRRVLLALKNNRLAIFELGTSSFVTPIKEGEEFGDDMPKMLPSWKGNDRISLQVSAKSHLLTEEQQKRGREEMAVIDTAGNKVSLLSGAWSDADLPGKSND